MDRHEAGQRAWELNLELFRRALGRRDPAYDAVVPQAPGRMFFPQDDQNGEWEPVMLPTEEAGQGATAVLTDGDVASGDLTTDLQTANALLAEGERLEGDRKPGDAVNHYVRVAALFRSSTDPELRLCVARALCLTGYCLEWLQVNEAASVSYLSVIDEFGNDQHAHIKNQVDYAQRRLTALVAQFEGDSAEHP